MTVSADYGWGRTRVQSFLGVSGVREDHPAAGALAACDISMLTGSIGTKATFATGSTLQLYLSIGADFSHYDDGITGRQRHDTPRLATGFRHDTGAGHLAPEVNGGRILKGTRDVEVRLNDDLNF